MHFVFIYGTLKRGFQNDALRPSDARFVGACRTVMRFPLVIGGKWSSPYLLDEPGKGEKVAGELFTVGDAGLVEFDALEGVNLPGGYRRIGIRVENRGDGSVCDAFAYVKDRETVGKIQDGPFSEYWYDLRYVIPADRDRVFE